MMHETVLASLKEIFSISIRLKIIRGNLNHQRANIVDNRLSLYANRFALVEKYLDFYAKK